MSKYACAALLAAFGIAAVPAIASAQKWDKLGERKVSPNTERDDINVRDDGGVYDAIRFDVDGGTIIMKNIVVHFGNNENWSPNTRHVFTQKDKSRIIDLPGNVRYIKSVTVWYEGVREGKGIATFELYGRHGKGGGGNDGDNNAPRWDKLGERKVSPNTERDDINVRDDGGVYDAIRFDVDGGTIIMKNIVVHFGNNENWSPNTRHVFTQKDKSRIIDLPGNVRYIKSVTVWYEGVREGKGIATFELYGRHGKGGGGKPPADKWEKIGSRIVDFGGDKDTISGLGDGKFRVIKLDVEGGDLLMYNIRVNFMNGEHYSPDTRLEFQQGTMSRTIDLPGDLRAIKSIEFWYKSRVRKGKATITVYGK